MYRWSLAAMMDNYYFSNFKNNNLNVYVVDQTVNLNHQEFSHIKTKKKLGGLTGIGNHGTHVAGIIVGKTVGIIRDPNVELYNYAICGSNDCDEHQTYDACITVKKHLQNSTRRGVINVSAGAMCEDEDGCDIYNEYLQRIVSAGGIIVAAAGNYNTDACNHYPSSSLDVIAVGNYDFRLTRQGSSNYGDCIDAWGPGTTIYSSFWNGYGYMTGTSMSSPAVIIIYVSIFLIYTYKYIFLDCRLSWRYIING